MKRTIRLEASDSMGGFPTQYLTPRCPETQDTINLSALCSQVFRCQLPKVINVPAPTIIEAVNIFAQSTNHDLYCPTGKKIIVDTPDLPRISQAEELKHQWGITFLADAKLQKNS